MAVNPMVEFRLMETLQYKSKNSEVEGEFLIGHDTLWSSQKIVAEIFGTSSQNISKYFHKIVQDGELIENEVSISSKILFQENSDFINSELIKSNNRGRPQIRYKFSFFLFLKKNLNGVGCITHNFNIFH